MSIEVNLDIELVRRKMTLTELAERVGITPVNLSILKNNRARAIRFSTLDASCRELGCQPGDILVHIPDRVDAGAGPPAEVRGESSSR